MSDILKAIGRPAAYEQLAEECTELAHAALKVARILRGKNPTPVSLPEAQKKLIEEYSDLRLCADVCHLYKDDKVTKEKARRWQARLKGRKRHHAGKVH